MVRKKVTRRHKQVDGKVVVDEQGKPVWEDIWEDYTPEEEAEADSREKEVKRLKNETSRKNEENQLKKEKLMKKLKITEEEFELLKSP